MPNPTGETLSTREFADLQYRMRHLPEGSLLFIEAELSPRQRTIISRNSRVTLITASDAGNVVPTFHCICLKIDYELAVETVRDVVINRGGKQITVRKLS